MKNSFIYPKELKNSNSLMAKYLTEDVFEKLKDRVTSNGYTLFDVINSGIENLDSGIGAYAGDEESYETFAPLFDKIIQDYHGFSKDDNHKTNMNINDLDAPNLDINSEYIISTRIRVARNLKNIPLGTVISKELRDKIEIDISKILLSFDGELKGKYYSLNSINSKDKETLIKNHFLFKEGDRFLQSAGLNRDWGDGRGIFHNSDKTFLLWINEEDQLRIISMQKGGDIKEVFNRLVKAIERLEVKLEFAYSKHLGYITSCPTNLGTAMRASVHIKLPNLAKDMSKFKEIANRYNLQIRGVDGEHSDSKDGIFDISNKRRLGVSEVECVEDMYNGVKALIKREKELSYKK